MLKQQNYIKICKNAACAVEEVHVSTERDSPERDSPETLFFGKSELSLYGLMWCCFGLIVSRKEDAGIYI